MKNYKYIYVSDMLKNLLKHYVDVLGGLEEPAMQALADKLGTRKSLLKTHLTGRTQASPQVLIRIVLLDAQLAANSTFNLSDDENCKQTTLLWDRIVTEYVLET